MDGKAALERALGQGHGIMGQRLLSETGATRHYTFGSGGRMVHDLEKIGGTVLAFTTVELKRGSPDAPPPVAVTLENQKGPRRRRDP